MLIVALLAIITMGGVLLTFEGDVLFRLQELNLFLPTKTFLRELMIYPGGVLSWMGCYFTQHLYHPTLGVSIMLMMWMGITLLTMRLARLRGPWILLGLMAPIALLGCLTQLGYWIYYMKLPGHVFVPTLATLLSLIAACIYDRLPQRWGMKYLWMGLVGIAGYPVMGAWVFMSLLLMVAAELHAEGRNWKRMAIPAVLAVALIGVVPQVMCRQWFEQTMPAQMYWAGLPSFQFGKGNYTHYHLPYYTLLVGLFLPHMLAVLPRKVGESTKPLAYALTLLAVVATAGVTWKVWYRDNNFHKEVSMIRYVEDNDWQGVLNISATLTEADTIPPTRVMTMMKNLALFRLHRAGEEMYRYPEGATPPNAPWEVRMTQVGGKHLYYHYGKRNFCYRWCMEDGVEYGWNIDQLRLMAKCAILSKDWEVARKYLGLLKQTRYYSEWAEKYEPYIKNEKLIKEDAEMEFITHLDVPGDRLDGDNTLIELYLLRTFANGQGADALYEEQTLLAALQMKDIDLFWPRFARYASRHGQEKNFHMPTHFQEAALLFSILEPQRESAMWPGMTNQEAMQRIPFDQSVKDTYQNFMEWNSRYNAGIQQRVAQQYQNRIASASSDEERKKLQEQQDSTFTAEMAKVFRQPFGHTYYYAYYLVRNQKTN